MSGVLDPASVISRSGSDLLNIAHVAEDVTLSTAERMALIARIVDGWESATAHSTERHRAARILPKFYDNGYRRPKGA